MTCFNKISPYSTVSKILKKKPHDICKLPYKNRRLLTMNEEQKKLLEREFRKDKMKKTLIISISIIAFIVAAVLILYGKVGHL